MIRLTDITFHTNSAYPDTHAMLEAQRASLLYVEVAMQQGGLEIEVIKQVTTGTTISPKNHYFFAVSRKSPGCIPRSVRKRLRESKPDVVLVHGFHFPWQVLLLRCLLPKTTRVMLWHHADHPPKRWIKIGLYRIAYRHVSRFLFAASGNAQDWINTHIIRNPEKIAELPPTLTDFTPQDKTRSRESLGFANGIHYLWVGRIDPVKDPLTVLNAFAGFAADQKDVHLHMVYQGGSLLHEMETLIGEIPALLRSVHLHGAVPNSALAQWYSAADFFISGSLREAGSVALLEAMACGCIPIVSAIPPSLAVTGNGRYGLVFTAGNARELTDVLHQSLQTDRPTMSGEVEEFFTRSYSVEAVAQKLFNICDRLLQE